MKKTIYTYVLFSILMITQFYAQEWEPIGADDLYGQPGIWVERYSDVIPIFDESNTLHIVSKFLGTTLIKKFIENKWSDIGSEGLSTDITNFSFAIDKSNTLHLVYTDKNQDYATFVKKFDGNTWKSVGGNINCGDQSSRFDIAIDNSGEIYVTCKGDPDKNQNNPYNYRLNVLKFENNSWVNIGDLGLLSFWPSPSLEVDNSGNVYVAYELYNSPGITVKKYDDLSWTFVGNKISPIGDTQSFPYLVIDSYNTPYISYQNAGWWTTDHGYFIRKLENDIWIDLNSNEIINDCMEYVFPIGALPIVVDYNGIPYIAYPNKEEKLTVRRYINNSWEVVGTPGFSSSEISYPKITMDKSGNLIVVYKSNGYLYAKKFNTTALAIDSYVDSEFKIYPNPVANILTVESTYPITKVEIYSILGQKLEEVESDFNSVSTDKLISGIYLAKIYSDKGATVRKLIKE